MCQMKVVLDDEGERQNVLDEVTRLEVTPAGVVLSTFFDDPRLVEGTQIQEIDFMKTTVVLVPQS
ncbi:MAG: CooT family nickel-binding protein [Deltaproteobacteria bacterium]|nr:CooT family nickel-binding protein [Deltaproteobacteria bacterium]